MLRSSEQRRGRYLVYLSVSRRSLTDCGVCFSPYTSLPSTLRFGPDRQCYYVPKLLLQSLGDISNNDRWDRATSLPDVDADSGHVIVHFLHTGTYQTLVEEGEDVTTSLSASKEFIKAALVCVAAKKYRLTDLEGLARKEMEQCGKDVSMTELVQLISEDTFGVLCSDSLWLQDFVTDKVEVAIKNGDDVFLTTGFFASIASSSLARFLAQEVVNIYHKENLKLRSKAATPNGHSFTTTGSSGAKEPLEAESRPPIEERVILDSPSEPVPEGTVGVHTLYDSGFGSPTSKKKTELNEIIESLPEPVSEPVLEVESVPEVKSEPVIYSTPQSVPEAEQSMVPEQEPKIEVTPVFEPLYEESIAIPEVVQAEPVYDPFVGLSKSQRKKLEKKMEKYRLAKEEIAKDAKAMEEAVHDFDSPEAPLPSAPSAPAPEAEPEAEPEPECVFDNPPFAESTPVVAESQSLDYWGWSFGSSTKKKKMKGAVCFDDTLTEQGPAMGSDPTEEVLLVNYTAIPDPTIEVAVAHNADECPWRVEHLSERDGWRACVPCELYVRNVASKLYPVGYPDANGFGTIK
jgi:hypothetical protein